MTPQDRDLLYGVLKEQSGLVLTGDKDYLLESRLMPIARRHGMASVAELVAKMRQLGSAGIQADVVEAMTTNESFFFRDKTPFLNFTETMMPEILKTRASTKRLRIWCSAASTGQEPYSLAICLKEMSERLAGWQIEILGTDISAEVLEKAKTGLYSQFEVQRGLPIHMLTGYFTQVGDMWQIDSAIRAMVNYREFNLLEGFAALGKFDIVFCRNVLIYFDQPTKSQVLDRIAAQMNPQSYLVLGAAETVIGLSDKYSSVPDKRGLYEVAGAGPVASIAQVASGGNVNRPVFAARPAMSGAA
jgi:chemotaxis protein methyltransferase CheR